MKKITLLLLFLNWTAFAQIEFVTNIAIGGGIKVNNKIVFLNSSPEFGKELWVSDGTSAGTNILRDINIGPGDSTPHLLTLLDGVVYFRANSHQIWRTDGTNAGTYLMVNNNTVTNPAHFIKTKNYIFFYAGDSGFNCCKKLWRMNVNPNSENLVTPESNFIDLGELVVLDYNQDVILFNAKTTSNGWAIWRTNGGVSLLVKDLYSPNVVDYKQMLGPIKIGYEIYFAGFSTDYGSELWKTDGTLTNTVLIKDIFEDTNYFNSSGTNEFIKIGSKVFFSARDKTHGNELWVTNGSGSGTFMVKDIYPGNNYNSWSPGSLTEFNGMLYFAQNDGNGTQLWKSDGSELGTTKVINIPNTTLQSPLFVHNNNIYFAMHSPESSAELWKLDSNDNTMKFSEIAPGTIGSYPSGFFELNGYIYFNATNDGTFSGSGTYRIKDQNLGILNNNFNTALKIYPNPTSNRFNIQGDHLDQFTVDIYDILGKKVGHFKNQKTIDIINLKSGLYIIKTVDLKANKTMMHKIIKE